MRVTKRNLFRIFGVLPEIESKHLLNIRTEHYLFTSLLGFNGVVMIQDIILIREKYMDQN